MPGGGYSLGVQRQQVALVHGGLYEPMSAARFWVETGVVGALADRDIDVLTPERLGEPSSWEQDAGHVAGQLAAEGVGVVSVVGGSNGCSTVARLAIAHPGLVQRIAFCWPVTVGQRHPYEASLADRISGRSGDDVAAALLSGETLRGMQDRELALLAAPVAVMASEPENLVHRRATARALLGVLTDAVELTPMPEPLMAGFEPRAFADAIVGWLTRGETPD